MLKRLAARQKRYKDWLYSADHELQDMRLKPQTLKALAEYRELLFVAWKTPDSNELEAANLEVRIVSLERTLQQLEAESRLRVQGKHPL